MFNHSPIINQILHLNRSENPYYIQSLLREKKSKCYCLDRPQWPSGAALEIAKTRSPTTTEGHWAINRARISKPLKHIQIRLLELCLIRGIHKFVPVAESGLVQCLVILEFCAENKYQVVRLFGLSNTGLKISSQPILFYCPERL